VSPDTGCFHKDTAMNLLILGAGNMGSALARRFAAAGHDVRIAATSLDKARRVAESIPGTVAVDAARSAANADAIVLATPFDAAADALRAAGPLDGKVVVDITNPLTADYSALTIGHDTSAAEEIAKSAPNAEVVKAFNTLFAQVLDDGARFGDAIAPTFVASDSARAKATATALAESIGFDVIDAGALKNARYLEPLAGLNIHLGYGAGLGTGIVPTWLRR
jgi:predicted dinucleotide-binding enzyme